MKNKNRKPNRLKIYDYSLPGYYFITICTHENNNLFGQIVNEKLKLNKMAKIVYNRWTEVPNHFSNVELDEFVIMPNHIHGIIIINEAKGDAKFASPTDRDKMLLSVVIQQFKRACTFELRKKFEIKNKIWLRSFYDRVIRNEKELYKIRKYIKQNPLKLELERALPENLDI